ncbi:MAG: polyprenyl synthetase family protein [Crocinitomicaceae bacterium]
MNSIANYINQIESELSNFELPKSPENLYDPLRYFFELGGKRLRPALTLMTAENFGGQGKDALHAAMAIELFHNFSLIHDDIMDEAPFRRGKETVHTKWNNHIAILSGDVLFVKAYESLAKCEAKYLPVLLNLFNKTATEVCEGQQMDMDFESRESVSEEEYIEMIRLKTSVLLGCAIQFGGIVSDLDSKMQQALYNFGQYIGIAFQIKDDLLDLYGESEKVGKQIGGDVLSDKKTLLSIKARELDVDMQTLAKITDNERRIVKAQEMFEESGAKNMVENAMRTYFNRAISSIELFPVDHKKLYNEFAEYLIKRSH